jgi:photosystem II stability/assembly factor-like uncharacterized protein
MEENQNRYFSPMKHILSSLFLIAIITFCKAQNLANFTQVGPVKFPDNPSVQTTGMGRVCELVYHPTDSNILFAVTASGGVFKSSNEGATWRPISDGLPQTACASLAINTLNPKVMFLGTGDANYNGGGLGIWRTNNGGATWFQTTSGIGNQLVSYIRYTPNDTNTLIAACFNGIYKSTDAGKTWVKKTTVNTSYRDLYYRPQSNTILYAATNSYFYRSYDNGNSWTQSDINSSITCAGIKIGVCQSDTSRLYCVVWKSGGTSPFGGVYKSTNNGKTFTLQVDTPNVLGYSSNGSSMDGQGSYNLAIAVDPKDANTIFVAGICIWKSTNGGANFTMKSPWAYGVHADKHGYLYSPFNSNKLFVYHDGGIDRTTDGGNKWTTLEDGLSASEFYKMGNSILYNDYIIGGLQDNGMDVAIDKKFYTVRGGDWGGDFAFDAFDSAMLYENGGIKRNIASFATAGINGQGGIYAVHPKDSNVLFEITTNLYRTTNLRANPASNVSWSQISSISGNTTPRALAYCKNSKGTFYMAYNTQFLYRSTDINAAAPSFTTVAFPFKSGEQIKQIETCDYDSNLVIVVTNQNRILRSNDKGNNWSLLNKNLPAVTVIKFLLDQKNSDSSMYAATAFGVYYRNKFYKNWINFSNGMPTVAQISDMEIMSDGTDKGRLHIATYGRGIWQSDLFKTTSVPPVADFTVQNSSSQTCANTVIIVDNSMGSPANRRWQILPSKGWSYVNGTDSLSSRAEVQFNTFGNYTISLTVTNAKGSHTKSVAYNYAGLSTAASCVTTTNILGGFGIGIYRFEFNTIDKSSSAGAFSYEDFTCNNATILKAGNTYTASVTTGTYNNENAKIYIDFNNNGVMNDAGELVGTIGSGKGKQSCSISIPVNPTVTGKFLRLRVVSDFATVNAPCGALSYGQSEDYSIMIDKTKPTLSVTIPKPTVSNSFTATFKASEILDGFEAKDITISNGTLSNFTQQSALVYTAKISPINNGKVNINIGAASYVDLVGNTNNAIADSTQFFLGIKTYTFAGLSTKDIITQTPTGGTISSYVPYGTKLDSLMATFTLSDTSTAYIGASLQSSSITKNSFKTVVTYTIKAKDIALTKTYTVTVYTNKNTACDLLTYGFVSPAVTGTITTTGSGGNVNLTVPYGTNLTAIKAWFTLSDSANAKVSNIKQNSNVTLNDFTSPLIYQVIAQDTTVSKTYIVYVKMGKSQSCDLLQYSLQSPAVNGVITTIGTTGGTVALTLPFGSGLSALVANFKVSDSATAYLQNVKQISGSSANNYKSILKYKVIAQDTNFSKIYDVSATVLKSDKAELFTYCLLSPADTGVITKTTGGGFVNITVPFNTDLTNLTGVFTLSDSAKASVLSVAQKSGITNNNFTDTIPFLVKSQNGLVSKLYKIKIEKEAPSGTIDVLEKTGWRVYPNPADEAVQMQSTDHLQWVEVSTVDGKVIAQYWPNVKQFVLTTEQWPAGIYMVRFRTASQVGTVRLMIAH